MALPANSVIECAFVGRLSGQRVLNLFHYRVLTPAPTTVTPAAELDQLLAILADPGVGSIKGFYLAAVPNNYTLEQITVQGIRPIRLRRQFTPINEAGFGGTATTPNVQASITAVTNFGGRDQVGGQRVPASPTNATGGNWTGPYVSTLGNLASAWKQDVDNVGLGSKYRRVIFHRKQQGVNEWTDIQDMFPQPTSRVIRRRTVGVGI